MFVDLKVVLSGDVHGELAILGRASCQEYVVNTSDMNAVTNLVVNSQ